jgi:hypothetical protein
VRRRGVSDPAASLADEAGIAVFKAAIERWVNETDKRESPHVIQGPLDARKAVTAGMRLPAAGRTLSQVRRLPVTTSSSGRWDAQCVANRCRSAVRLRNGVATAPSRLV